MEPPLQFPKKLNAAIASITQDFSFAYLNEAFVATLLAIANDRSENGISSDDGGEDLDDYELWREMKRQVKSLRQDMDTHGMKEFYARDPMDLAWRAPDSDSNNSGINNTQSPPPMTSSSSSTTIATTNAFSALPFRSGANRAERNLNNPHLMATDCDARHAPLMTDGGMFVDSRFDGIGRARGL